MGHGSLGLGRKTPWPAGNRLLAAVHRRSDLRKGRVRLAVYWVAHTGHVGCGSRASRSELLGSTNRRPTRRSTGNRLPSPTGDNPSEDRVLWVSGFPRASDPPTPSSLSLSPGLSVSLSFPLSPLHLSSLTLCLSLCDRVRGTKKEEK
jgi:hypothetical protein